MVVQRRDFVCLVLFTVACAVYFLGTIGHVAHGKSTLVKAISGVQVTEFIVSVMKLSRCNHSISSCVCSVLCCH